MGQLITLLLNEFQKIFHRIFLVSEFLDFIRNESAAGSPANYCSFNIQFKMLFCCQIPPHVGSHFILQALSINNGGTTYQSSSTRFTSNNFRNDFYHSRSLAPNMSAVLLSATVNVLKNRDKFISFTLASNLLHLIFE